MKNPLVAAVKYLAASPSLAGVLVSGPRKLPLPNEERVQRSILVQGGGGPQPLGEPQQLVNYTLRCIGADDDECLATYDALVEACRTVEGWPKTNILVDNQFWLYRVDVSGPTGPTPDPVAEWPTIVAVMTMKWATV